MSKIDNEVKKTMGSLDDVRGAKASPYFYTKLTARMESEQSTEMSFSWKLAVASTTILLVLLNVWVVLNSPESEIVDDDNIEALAVEYSVTSPSLYDNDITYENE